MGVIRSVVLVTESSGNPDGVFHYELWSRRNKNWIVRDDELYCVPSDGIRSELLWSADLPVSADPIGLQVCIRIASRRIRRGSKELAAGLVLFRPSPCPPPARTGPPLFPPPRARRANDSCSASGPFFDGLLTGCTVNRLPVPGYRSSGN
jgi:hypothetical protein